MGGAAQDSGAVSMMGNGGSKKADGTGRVDLAVRWAAALEVLLAVLASCVICTGCAPDCTWLRFSEGRAAYPCSDGSRLEDVWQRTACESLQSRFTLAAAGDVIFDRGVRAVCERRGADWPLSAVAPIFSSADAGFVNLETSLAVGGRPIPGKGIWFRSDPKFAQELAKAGVNVVTVANNHVLDYDEAAFAETLAALADSSIAVCGGGFDLDEARSPAIVSAGGVRIAFLGYSELADIFWTYSYPRSFRAGLDSPGVAPMDEKMIVQDIRKARAVADHVVVSYHWGEEYARMPNTRQMQIAHMSIDAGASLVLGHHPHVLQPVEVYNGGIIFYSLGNFVFDQTKPDTVESMIARVTFSPSKIVSAQILPMRIERCRPRPLVGWAARTVLDRLIRDSAWLGAVVAPTGGRGLILIPGTSVPVETEGVGEFLP